MIVGATPHPTSPHLTRPLSRYLTTLQILQFVVSLVMAVFFVMAHQHSLTEGRSGCTGWNAFLISTAFNFTLLGLFVNFYVSAYRDKKAKKKSSSFVDKSDKRA